jgi:hypothetical protein
MKNFKTYIWVAVLSISVTLFFSCSKNDDVFQIDPIGDSNPGDGNNDGQQNSSQSDITLYRVENGNIIKIKDFRVTGNNLIFQQDIAKHNQIWRLIKKIVPSDQLTKMSEFMIYNGAPTGSAGYVTPKNSDLSKWQMGIAINFAYDRGFNNNGELAYTIIHEFGHILSLNNTQLNASISQRDCVNYYPGEGCSKTNSYINETYQLYWKDIANEHESAQGSQNGQQMFYNMYSDRFVTKYASTNPAEDIAEVFATFVTQRNRPSGNTVAEKKIILMYNRNELVAFRNHIRHNLNLRGKGSDEAFELPVPGKWKIANTFGNPRKTKCRH